MQTSDGSQIDSNIYYRQLCDHAGVAMIGTDSALLIRSWNLAAGRMFGASAKRMVGTPLGSVIPQEGRNEAEGCLHRAITEGETSQFECDHRDESGGNRELACTIAPIIGESGEIIGASACFRDISRRTDLLAQLSESRRMASLGELAGALAHHFNNLLGGIVTCVSFALASDDPGMARRGLEQVNNAVGRATALVRGLLAFAEGDRCGEDLGDFTEVVSVLADEIDADIRETNVVFCLNLPRLPTVAVVRNQFLTVLRNIKQNAMDAMPNGGQLTVDVALEENWAIVRIADTGCGLDKSAQSRVFDPFWSTKGAIHGSSTPGIGLGLAIAHGIVKSVGGRIEVESQLGQGACFTVHWPRHAADDREQGRQRVDE